jgi:hypothetical protein
MKHYCIIQSIVCFFLISITGLSEEYQAYVIDERVTLERCPLESNKPDNIYRELLDPSLLLKVLKASGGLDSSLDFRALAGGDSNGFTISIRFFKQNPILNRKIADILQNYVTSRWKGVSIDGSIALLKASNAPEEVTGRRSSALHDSAPWLALRAMRTLKKRDSVSIWWLRDDGDFLFYDTNIGYWVSFLPSDGKLIALVHALDAQEFQPEKSQIFTEAASIARARVSTGIDGNPESTISYWRELKSVLQKKGITWLTPEELNPGREWH